MIIKKRHTITIFWVTFCQLLSLLLRYGTYAAACIPYGFCWNADILLFLSLGQWKDLNWKLCLYTTTYTRTSSLYYLKSHSLSNNSSNNQFRKCYQPKYINWCTYKWRTSIKGPCDCRVFAGSLKNVKIKSKNTNHKTTLMTLNKEYAVL